MHLNQHVHNYNLYTHLGGGIDYGYAKPRIYEFTFHKGNTSATLNTSIPINSDAIVEDGETFNISIMNISVPYGLEPIKDTATIKILDNRSNQIL